MELLKKVTVARAVWYFVPGLLFLFYFFLPLAAFKYEETTRLIRDYGIGTLALLGLVIGFVLDGLRLYRLRPKYNQIKSEFLDQLRDTVGANLDPHYLFLGINEFAGRDREAGLDYKYTVWAVIGQFTFLTWCEAGIWFLSPIVLLIKGNQVCEFFGAKISIFLAVLLCDLLLLIFLVIGFRLLAISYEDQKRANVQFLSFTQQNLNEIKSFLKIRR